MSLPYGEYETGVDGAEKLQTSVRLDIGDRTHIVIAAYTEHQRMLGEYGGVELIDGCSDQLGVSLCRRFAIDLFDQTFVGIGRRDHETY